MTIMAAQTSAARKGSSTQAAPPMRASRKRMASVFLGRSRVEVRSVTWGRS
jgi:hypothetical protein